jgi:peptidoglycan/LPS O-acetylase OafA/YrhL
MRESRLDYLDALRGWAAFAVIVTHAGSQTGGAINEQMALGAHGVQLFFTLSAFTLFMTHYGRHSSERTETLNFFLRRFFRLAPVFYVVIVAVSAYDWITRSPDAPTLGQMAALFTFTHSLFPAYIDQLLHVEWSLGNEAIFYVMLPFLFIWVRDARRAVYLLLGTLLVARFLTVWLQHQGDLHFAFFYFGNQAPAFAFGIVLFFATRRPLDPKYAPMFLAIALFVFWAVTMGGEVYAFPQHILLEFGYVALIIALGLKPYRFFVNALTVRFGEISYSVYLLHVSVLFSLGPLATHWHLEGYPQFFFLLTGTVAITWALASVAYRFIERPGVELGQRVIQRIAARSLVFVDHDESRSPRLP